MSQRYNPTIDLKDYINILKSNLKAEITAIKKLWSNEAIIKAELKSKYFIEPLILREPVPSQPLEKPFVASDGTKHPSKTIIQTKVTIAYSGRKELFNCKPVNFVAVDLSDFKHEIYKNVINVYIQLQQWDSNKHNQALEHFVRAISANFERINTQSSFFNDELDHLISSNLAKKEAELSQQIKFMEQIGLSVNPLSDQFMIPQPIKSRKIPSPVDEAPKNKSTSIVPTLQSAVYNDIISVLHNVGAAIERKPSIYRDKHEEDLRDIFLLFLETRYESTAGVGEAFNRNGKTDILLKYAKDGSNLFVAECKVWTGAKKLLQAIDQLLGYLTHRDSKSALMLFVKQKEFKPIINSLKSTVTIHPNYRKFLSSTYDTSFAFEMALPGDPESFILMEFMLFHFPSKCE